MALFTFVLALCWAATHSLASPGSSPLEYSLRTVNAPGLSALDTHRAIARELAAAKLQGRNEIKSGETILDRSWDGAILLKIEVERPVPKRDGAVSGGVEIACQTCYVKGKANALLRIDGDFDAGSAIKNTITSVEGEVEKFKDTAEEFFENWAKGVLDKITDNGFQASDLEFPTFPYDFSLDIPAIPKALLRFQFDGLELYMLLDTTLSIGATYTINLYSSNTPAGISVGENLEVGLIFSIDLIFSVEAEITISSGFHIKLEDGVVIEIPMFSDDVSGISFNGGQFEFLPVTIETGGVVLSAILRIGIHAGVTVSPPGFNIEIGNKTLPKLSGGIEVGIFANIAEFVTSVNVAPNSQDCELQVVQEYKFALGAAAGATLAFSTQTWGPVAATSVPIFYTTLADVCAVKGKPTPMESSAPQVTPRVIEEREDLETTTISTEITLTGVACPSTMPNCPVSLQTTTKQTITSTLNTAVPSGVTPTFPTTISNTVSSTIDFGTNALPIAATSGTPKSFIPSATGDTKAAAINGEVGGVSKKVIVGVSVGLGVPILLAIAGGIFFFLRRKKYSSVPRMEQSPMVEETEYHGAAEPFTDTPAKKDAVGVSVAESR
ncbi:hypothetical protein EJ04DRAFT_514147 [Polyplosphaeria fusca]|uniref:Mid2 domain-containing protein n=1 Tax=Polyplosphaeria fusca TaxID=682080 RepID=A0A9P4UZ70_9PLEO|nr:hypothetical protein EJ04DRAFT_514147 [Polyplosphaeria fusca]